MSKVNARMGTSKENPDVSEMNAGFKLRFFCAPYTLVSDPYNVYIISGSLFTMHSPIFKCAGEESLLHTESMLVAHRSPWHCLTKTYCEILGIL